MDRRQLDQSLKPKKPTYISQIYQKVKREDRYKKNEMLNNHEQIEELAWRKQNYGKFVKAEFSPYKER